MEAEDDESVIFSDDVVNLKGNSTKLGLVLRNGNTAEESSDSYDSADEGTVKPGQLLVCWYPLGEEEVVPECEVELFDRALQPGDRVRHRHPEETNQRGVVTDIQIFADIRILGTQQIIKNVDCKKYITPLQDLCPRTKITFKNWLGSIKKAYRRVTLWLKNGSRCSLEEEQLDMLYDFVDKRDEDCPFYNAAFFPSQSVVGPAKAFKEAKWLTKIKPLLADQNQIKAVVEECKVVKIDVDWQVFGACPPDCTKEFCARPPATTIHENEFDRVAVFEHYQQAEIQIGDKGYYIVKEEDIIGTANTNEKDLLDSETNSLSSRDSSKVKIDNLGENPCSADSENNVLQSGTYTKDSSTDVSKSSSSLFTNSNVSIDNGAKSSLEPANVSDSDDGDVESDGGEHQKPKSSKQDGSSKHSRRRRRKVRHRKKQQYVLKMKAGDKVCVEVVKTKTMPDIMWQDGRIQQAVDGLQLMPSFCIDDFHFFPGFFVLDRREVNELTKYGVVQTAQCSDRTCQVKWFSADGQDLSVEQYVSVYDIVTHPDYSFNPGDLVVKISGSAHADELQQSGADNKHGVAGQVVRVNSEGKIVVAFVGGDKVISALKPQDLYVVDSEDDGDYDDSISDTESDEEEWETASEEERNEEERNEDADAGNHSDGGNDATALIMSAPALEGNQSSPAVQNVDIDQLNLANSLTSGVDNVPPEKVESFQMLSHAPRDHAFKKNSASFIAKDPKKFLAALKKDISILKSSLPDSILIRGYDDAMDLFTILIHGAVGTPYEDGLFIFDMSLPVDYPASPPNLFYRAFSMDILNPNLYQDGTVCISLLGTWSGRDNEKWTAKSTLLQLLLSIQGLILCKEPYYNEAGYDKYRGTAEGERNSRLYNEIVILQMFSAFTRLTCIPHTTFNKEVKEHLRNSRERIIQRFKSWLAHAKITNNEVNAGEDSGGIPPQAPDFLLFPISKGFRICFERNVEALKQLFDTEL